MNQNPSTYFCLLIKFFLREGAIDVRNAQKHHLKLELKGSRVRGKLLAEANIFVEEEEQAKVRLAVNISRKRARKSGSQT